MPMAAADPIVLGSSSPHGPNSSPGLPTLESLMREATSTNVPQLTSCASLTQRAGCTALRPAGSIAHSNGSQLKATASETTGTAKTISTTWVMQQPNDNKLNGATEERPSSTSALPTSFVKADYIVHSKKKKPRKCATEEQSHIKGTITKPGRISSSKERPTFKFPPSMGISRSMSSSMQNQDGLEPRIASGSGITSGGEEESQTIPLPDLRKSFSYKGSETAASLNNNFRLEGEPKSKRQRVDSCSRESSSKQPATIKCNEKQTRKSKNSPVKKPAPKSARTVTGVAIAQFHGPDTAEDSASTQVAKMFLQGLPRSDDPQATARFILDPEGGGPEHHPNDTSKQSTTTKTKKARKGQSSMKSKNARVPKLLDPDGAKRKIDRQDIFFGTSSQLTKNEPLSEIREVQQAIANSEAIILDLEKARPAPATANDDKSGSRPKKGLWSAGARGHDDSLIEAEEPRPAVRSREEADLSSLEADVDMSEKPEKPRADLTSQKLRVATSSAASLARSRLMCFDARRSPLHTIPLNTTALSSVPSLEAQELRSFSTTAGQSAKVAKQKEKETGENGEPAKRPRGRPKKNSSDTNTSATKEPGVRRPRKKTIIEETNSAAHERNTGVIVDVQRAKVMQDGVAPARKRPGPKKGWKKAAAEAAAQQAQAADPNLEPGTRKHDAGVEDISDHEPRAASTPRKRRRTSRSVSPPSRQLELSPSQMSHAFIDEPEKVPKKRRGKVPSLGDKELAEIKTFAPSVFPLITQAIKSTPPSDLRPPTWHEKILLYDPIVLEDLRDWLNSGPLAEACTKDWDRNVKVEVDCEWDKSREVTARMVQAWCEEHSICCLWREGLRGGVKLRY